MQLIAEVGCSHIGKLSRALELTELAAKNGADFVKFQKRDPYISTPERIRSLPHPNPQFSYGDTYLDHRINLELSIKEHESLKKLCEELNVGYGCSVWDLYSAKEIIKLEPELLKIPSACNNDIDLIEYCTENHKGPVHISLGMTSLKERQFLYSSLKNKKDKVILYHCVSEYPCPFERMQLLGISEIVKNGYRAGFSNHGYGIATDIAAMMLGAEFDERHFIDDRAFRHTDAAASLEPEGLRKLKRDIRAVAMSLKPKCDPTNEEKVQISKLRSK